MVTSSVYRKSMLCKENYLLYPEVTLQNLFIDLLFDETKENQFKKLKPILKGIKYFSTEHAIHYLTCTMWVWYFRASLGNCMVFRSQTTWWETAGLGCFLVCYFYKTETVNVKQIHRKYTKLCSTSQKHVYLLTIEYFIYKCTFWFILYFKLFQL